MVKILTGTAKILKRNSDNIVVRAYTTTDVITLESNQIKVANNSGVELERWTQGTGYNNSNMTVHDSVTLPSGYAQGKFKYDGSSWAQDSNWIDHPGEPIGNVETAINDSATNLHAVSIKSTHIVVGQILQIENEKVTIAAIVDGDNITISRGAASTTAASHDANKIVYKI